MAYSTNYQCPACTGPLRFDAKTNLLVCDYCGSKFQISEIDKKYDEKIKQSVEKGVETQPSTEDSENKDESAAYKTYTCSSCGAELFCDEVTVASSCPYCGNPNVIAGKFKKTQMPDKVIPFKMDKKEAVQALTKFYKGKKLLPKVFSAQNHIEEVKGVYIPFWLFNGSADVSLKASAQKVAVYTDARERVETISHYEVSRKGNIPFKDVPVDASKKMDNDMMDSLEPFNYDDLKDFSPSYLPGFFAECYDDTPEDCQARLEKRISKTAVSELMSDITDYNSVQVISKDVKLNLPEKPEYAFFPVWLLSTKWKDTNYLFAMNGQTGRMVGKLPVDKGRFCGWLFGIMFAGAVILAPLIYYFLIKGGF